MRSNGMTRGRARAAGWVAAMLLTCAVVVIRTAPAEAQLAGDLTYLTTYDLVPNPPTTNLPTTLILNGYTTGCGTVEEASVTDPSHVVIRLRSSGGCDTTRGWSLSFALGVLPLG